MVDFSGVSGANKDSWKCCIDNVKDEKEEFNDFLGKLGRQYGKYVKRVVPKTENLYTVETDTKHKTKNKYYTIVFTLDSKYHTIVPLFLIPFPCNNADKCDNIKKL